MSYNFGYKDAAKHAKDMGFGKTPARVTVKPHTRAPRVVKAPSAPPIPRSPAQGFAKGGAVKSKKKGAC